MTLPTIENIPDADTPDLAAGTKNARHKRPAATSKKDQLLALISKPSGARISVLTERLALQPHSVRAALSGLRKKGHIILAEKAPKTGELVYRLVSPTVEAADTTGDVAA